MSAAGAPVAPKPSVAAEAGRTIRSWLLPIGIFLGALVVWDLLVRILALPQFILPAPSAIANAWVTYLPELWASTTYTLVEILLGPGHRLRRRARLRDVRGALVGHARVGAAVRDRGQLDPDHRLRAAHQQLVRPRQPALEGDDRRDALLLPGDDQHGPWPAPRRAGGARADALARRDRHADVPRGPLAERAAVHLHRAQGRDDARDDRRRSSASTSGRPELSLGQYIVRYAAYLNLERSWAAISFASAIGITLYILVVIAERLVMPWHASFRATHDGGVDGRRRQPRSQPREATFRGLSGGR